MHKKLEKDLISLAHEILKMKNRADIFALKDKSRAVFEKLSMLAFVEEYVNTTPNLETTKEDLIATVAKAFETKETVAEEKIISPIQTEMEVPQPEEVATTPTIENIILKEEPILEQPFEELESILNEKVANENVFKEVVKKDTKPKTQTLEEELHDTISVDIMADLFENVQPKSLNDKLVNTIQIGLNDRIAFVKNLFNGEQEDFNRVISQLNSYETESEAKKFIENVVKPDYNWSEHEALENRLLEIISRKFA